MLPTEKMSQPGHQSPPKTAQLFLIAVFCLATFSRAVAVCFQEKKCAPVLCAKKCVCISADAEEMANIASELRLAVDCAALSLLGDKKESGTFELVSNLARTLSENATGNAPEIFSLWFDQSFSTGTPPTELAVRLGQLRGALDFLLFHLAVAQLKSEKFSQAQVLRAAMTIPASANGLDGFEAIEGAARGREQNNDPAEILKKEFSLWQSIRIRSEANRLIAMLENRRAGEILIALRAGEVLTAAELLSRLISDDPISHSNASGDTAATADISAEIGEPTRLVQRLRDVVQNLPNLLEEKSATRRQSLLAKLINLVPFEYQSGVKEGKIIIPVEYREAVTFTNQALLLVDELEPWWRATHGEAIVRDVDALRSRLRQLASAINTIEEPQQIRKLSSAARDILTKKFSLQLREQGKSRNVVSKTADQVRSLLAESLDAALRKRWRESESLRLEAYTLFDLEIEMRTIPRSPSLALRAEKSFLDGTDGVPGIKAAIDKKLPADELRSSFQKTAALVEECEALLSENISPASAVLSALVIVVREGLEAVIILAALLAGLRGDENRIVRRRIWQGCGVAVVFTAATFLLGRYVVESFSHHAERLEAVISALAVAVLLIVTNWVFHKYYWTGWNAKLRELGAMSRKKTSPRFQALALWGVGFLTIYREGFETTLFLQSLILESSLKYALVGTLMGLAVVCSLGAAIFYFSAKLPYRKMLVFTGVLVVGILFTFVGSTVRLFQTVGWLPVHPISGFELPSWAGQWLGLYPTWEGMLLPIGAMFYVLGAWLTVRIVARVGRKKSISQKPHHLHHETVSEILPAS